MKTIAITGGIGAGKSTVCEMFRNLGARIIDADILAHQVYEPGTPLHQAIRERFGPEILTKTGKIDRVRLGKIVFRSPEEKRWLESQTHPAVRELIRKQIQAAKEQSDPLILVEAALHVETGYYREFDGLIVVHVAPEVQIQRVMVRNQIDRDEAEHLLANQMPVEEKKKYADWVIDNSGDLETTRKQVRELFDQLLLNTPAGY